MFPTTSTAYTVPFTFGFQGSMAPLLMLMAPAWLRVTSFEPAGAPSGRMRVNCPPRYILPLPKPISRTISSVWAESPGGLTARAGPANATTSRTASSTTKGRPMALLPQLPPVAHLGRPGGRHACAECSHLGRKRNMAVRRACRHRPGRPRRPRRSTSRADAAPPHARWSSTARLAHAAVLMAPLGALSPGPSLGDPPPS